mgnify:FL=1
MGKMRKFRKEMDRPALLWLSVATFLMCVLSYMPLASAQGAHVAALGQQTMDRFLCDLPYVVSLPVALLLAAILAVCAVRGKGQRPLAYSVVVFLLVFMLWMVSSSQLLAAKLAGTVALYRVANFFLYLVPAAANLVVLEALEEKYRAGQRVVVFCYAAFAVLATGADLFGVSGVSLRQQMYAAGDMILRGFARTVRAELDKKKSFYRWGGEEFVVLLPGCDLDAAAVVGNRLRRTVAAFLQYEKHPVTVSVGVSVCHGGYDTAQALFERADSALYAAKAAGRNCLRVESPQAAIGEEALG